VTLAVALLFALGSAVALNWSYLTQHTAASGMPPLELRHPLASLRMLFSDLRWVLGFFVGIGGWVLYVAALALAPLSLVQAVSAGGIGVLALLVWRKTGVPLTRREQVGVGAAVGGLALLALSLCGCHAEGTHGTMVGVSAWLLVSGVAALLAAGPLARVLAPGAGLGIAAGVMYAAGDVATKAATGGGIRFLFVPALLACHGCAFVALQLAFQRGRALATAGVATLFTNALPIVAGLTLLHEHLPGGPLGVLRLVAFAAVVLGAASLARPESPAEPSGLSPTGIASTID
jgi:hypothetical protein